MASRSLAYHPEARAEVDAAFDYYRERSVSIAQAFYDELEAAQFAIGTNPETWAAYSFGTHRYLLKRFPFVIVYRIVSAQVEIVAVAHGRRKPGYWAARLS